MNPIIFIGGVPRSGTTLVQKILDMHSQVYAGPEFDHLPQICRVYTGMRQGLANGRQSVYYSAEQLTESFRAFINDIFNRKAKAEKVLYISEKTPSNVLVFGTLKELFPSSKFIFVVRDPRANIVSFRTVAKRAHKFGDRVTLGKTLSRDLQLIHKYLKAGNDFYLNNPNQCFLLHFEELLKTPEEIIQKLCAFLNISFEEAMMRLDSRESDASKLINEGNLSVRAWSTPGMLEKGIEKAKMESWRTELGRKEKIIIDEFFRSRGYECLREYSFSRVRLFQRVLIAPTRFKEMVKRVLRRSIEFAKDY